ncbi:aldo/keto reductase (plasmid) [Halorarum halophilum]|uniref:Aldo/keto reductase n=1 Tax=Halorarum halophilum TaxID=2743090 RepID=A0A7D5KYH2_9EURY|nr:aldo/keto reductase [Halobaculum halophilum]QLG29898.1 aldo/keto reductase [Halobaculum halophilum]
MTLETVSLGGTGLEVSRLAMGTWRFGRRLIDGEERYDSDDGIVETNEERAADLLDAYAERGGNFIDTADKYGDGKSEEWIGNWLADRDREDFIIATKIHRPRRPGDPNGEGLNRKHLRRQIDISLDRLGTDYVDLLYCHRWDDRTPAEEFMRTLDGLVSEGKVNYLGISSGSPDEWKIVKANEIARRRGYEPFTVTQPRYNLVDREIEANYMDMCRDYGLGIVPWSPLAWGFLTGKYSRDRDFPDDSTAAADARFKSHYLTEENFDVLEVTTAIAEEVGAKVAHVALAWQLHHPDVTAPIVGASTVEQLEENLDADDVSLTDDQFARLDEAKTASLV